jgi:hypothetical protein
VLARLNERDAIKTSYLSFDGTRLLVRGVSGTSDAALLSACEEALEASGHKPKPLENVDGAWAQRGDRAEWLSRSELWRLSWREAETFADRYLVALEKRFGDDVSVLRPTLVASCFESVRPADGSGPTPKAWAKGATLDERRKVLYAEAAEFLTAERLAELEAFMNDPEAVGRILKFEPKADNP